MMGIRRGVTDGRCGARGKWKSKYRNGNTGIAFIYGGGGENEEGKRDDGNKK
jgi:hypothetical protein